MNKKKEKQKNTFEKIYEVIKTMASKPSGLIGLTILIFHVILAITSPLYVPYDYKAIDPTLMLTPPSSEFWFGTDSLGRDVFTRTILGGRTALTVTLQSAGLIESSSIFGAIVAVLSIVTGTVFLMWLGEQISERGIGNGISIIIATSILTGIPAAIGQALEQSRLGEISILLLIGIGLLSMAVIAVVVFIERGQRRITVNYAQRQQGRRLMQAQTSHLPFKVNMAGVIPAIFASTFLLFPASISTWFGDGESSGFLASFSLALEPGQPLYIIVFAGLIISFCFIWLALTFNTKDVSDNLKRSGAYIAGIRPGEQTANYIDSVLARLTVFGAIYLTLICLLPLALINFGGVSPAIAVGGTSVLIIVVVLMDFMAQVQSHMMSSQYASLMKKANLKNYKR